MKKTIALLLIIALCAVFAACGKGGTETDASSDTTAGPIETSGSGNDTASHDTAPAGETETFEIDFAGLTLKYPEKWKDSVTVTENEDGSLEFSSSGVILFRLFANSDNGSVLGTVKGDKNTVITAEFNESDALDDTLAAMQEDINVIIRHLSEDYDFEAGTAIKSEYDGVFAIETSVTTLYYPTKWQDKITVDVSPDRVSFTSNGANVFDILFFESSDGFLLGTYGDTPLCVVDYDVEDDELAAMQEDINVILQYLLKDDNFTVH